MKLRRIMINNGNAEVEFWSGLIGSQEPFIPQQLGTQKLIRM